MKSFLLTALCCIGLSQASASDPDKILDLWPAERMPGPKALAEGTERDLTRDSDRLIAGERIIKLGHVATPQLHVYQPPADKATGAAVVICPGGGFHILAWDLEGTEVAEWLNQQGITALVLKYRVPTGGHGDDLRKAGSLQIPAKALGPAMDTQRSLSLARANAEQWQLDPQRIGVLGFSAGGATAALTALANGQRTYEPVDAHDDQSCRADFACLIYPGGLVDRETGVLQPHLQIPDDCPPMFFAHAADDRVTCLSSSALFTALKLAGVSAELHIYATGGHGYGLRRTQEPVTSWPDRAAEWLRGRGIVTSPADRFVTAWNAGAPLPNADKLDLDQAYDLQRSWVMKTLDASGIGGVKGGVVSPGGQKWLGIDEPVGAILRASGRYSSDAAPEISLEKFPDLKLETEIGFVIGKTIDKKLTSVQEFQQSVSGIIPVIELISGAWQVPEGGPKAADLAAINVSAAGYIEGKPVAADELDPKSLVLRFSKDGDPLHEAPATDCWHGPWETGLWLANFAQRQGIVLQPGQIIICGALGKIQPGQPGRYELDAGKLGKITFSVVP